MSRRIRGLGLDNVEDYRAYLESNPTEWDVLDDLTRITISRFFRERDAFGYLCDTALPELQALAAPNAVRIWSAGCAGGEEAYTLAIAAHERRIPVRILATDWDERQLQRAREARYSQGSLKELPVSWQTSAFEPCDDEVVLRPKHRAVVELRRQDIRRNMPVGPFHLVLCRYLAFTYFNLQLQREVAKRLLDRAIPGGFVVLGKHESWPSEVPGLIEVRPALRIYRKEL